jgi:hypothetical protein
MPCVAKNVYYIPKKILHPFHVRILRKGKLVFFSCSATMEEAIERRDRWLGLEDYLTLAEAGRDALILAT